MMRRCQPLLGTFVEITGPDEICVAAGFAAISAVHSLMSAHDAASDIGRINRFAWLEPVPLDRQTASVIHRAIQWSELSDGAFDIVRAGRAAIDRGEIPRHPGQPDADTASNWRDIVLRAEHVFLRRHAVIDVGGIAKGYAVDQAIEAMRQAGAHWGLVNAGGDVRGFGDREWKIAVARPGSRDAFAEIPLHDRAVATSAGRDLKAGSLDFQHISERNTDWISVTVTADEAVDADALTKIVMANPAIAGHCLCSVEAQALGLTPDGKVEEVPVSAIQ